jgi:hypothetical protein
MPFYLLANVYIGPMLWVTQGLVKPHMRATASAILLFVLNMVGLGAGPFVVGFCTDRLAPTFGVEAIRYALAAVALMSLVAALCFHRASRTLVQDLASRDATAPGRRYASQKRRRGQV